MRGEGLISLVGSERFKSGRIKKRKVSYEITRLCKHGKRRESVDQKEGRIGGPHCSPFGALLRNARTYVST